MYVRLTKLQNVIFPHPCFSLLSSCVHRKAHILEIRRLFLGWDSSSRKATTSGVGVACSVLKRRRWRTQDVVDDELFDKWKETSAWGWCGYKAGGAKRKSQERSAHRRPNDLLTNERSTEISFILHYLFPLSQSRCYPSPRSLPRLLVRIISHYLIFSTTNKRTERITDPSSYGSHRHGPSRHCEYTRTGIALPAGNRENYLPSTRVPYKVIVICRASVRKKWWNIISEQMERTITLFTVNTSRL